MNDLSNISTHCFKTFSAISPINPVHIMKTELWIRIIEQSAYLASKESKYITSFVKSTP